MVQRSDNVQRRAQNVSINLMNGDMLDGYLLGFSPIMNKLHFFQQSDANETLSRKLDIEDIVYIGLHSSSDSEKHSKQGMDELNVITVNSDKFEVFDLPSMSNTPGFYALLKDQTLPYRQIFFYHHGIRY